VIVGGSAFASAPGRAPTVGGDGFAARIADVGALALEPMGRYAPGPAGARALEWSELVRTRRQISVESAERLMWYSGPLIPRSLRTPKALGDRFSDLMRFVEAAVLVDDHILIDYARWLAGRDATVLRVDQEFTVAMLRTIRDQIEETLPVTASAADAAACVLGAGAA
jgi:hypothetical protein